MASTFTVHEASGYEQLMGRWSRKLAPAFVEFAGLAPGEKLLDVGCGTGSLTFELAVRGDPIEIRLGNARLTLRKAEAAGIRIELHTGG